MPNERLHFGCESLAFAKNGATAFTVAHGVQDAGMNVRFNLEQVFELGQLEIYENVERAPEVEVTASKFLDGWPLLWHLATNGAVVGTLAGRLNQRCQIGMSLYSDLQDSASGTPLTQIVNSGMYPNSLSYELNVNGAFKETVSFVGNDRRWGASQYSSTAFNNDDTPLAISGSGGVNMREDLIIGEGTGNISLFPTEIEGVTSSGTIQVVTGTPSVYLQTVRVNVNLNRSAIYSLGKRGACYRFAQVPIPVESSFEVNSKQGDQKSAYEETDNLSNQRIRIVCREGTTIDLGTKNKLDSINFQPGAAGGGGANVGTTSYQYRTYNSLLVQHRMDPSGL